MPNTGFPFACFSFASTTYSFVYTYFSVVSVRWRSQRRPVKTIMMTTAVFRARCWALLILTAPQAFHTVHSNIKLLNNCINTRQSWVSFAGIAVFIKNRHHHQKSSRCVGHLIERCLQWNQKFRIDAKTNLRALFFRQFTTLYLLHYQDESRERNLTLRIT